MFGKAVSHVDSQEGLKEQQRKYLNICVVGQPQTTADPSSGTLCKYDATYTSAILDNPKEWVVGIDRFNIPMLRVPRFIDPSTQTPASPATVTIVATDQITQVVSTFTATVQLSGVLTPDPFSSGYVFLASQWVTAINTALVNASTALNASALGVRPIAPLITFNPATGIISLLTQAGWFGTTTVPSTSSLDTFSLDLYFNQSMWRFLPTLPQTFFNYSTAAAPLNTNSFYSKVTFSPGSTNAAVPKLAAALPNFSPGTAPPLTSVSAGILTTALVAGTSYTQLAISGGTLRYLAAGQAIVLSDSASGTTQTVFVAEGDCNIGATTINVLLFTAVFAFPITTTTIRIFSVTAIILQSAFGVSLSAGTQLSIAQSTLTLTRGTGLGDLVLYVAPAFTAGGIAGNVVSLLNPQYDTISTESPVPPIWTSISSVRVKSTKLPIAMEFSPDIVTSGASTTSSAAASPMITDFVIDTTSSLQTADLVQFVTENPRWIDLLGDMPLYGIDLTVNWVDFQGVEHPVYIPAGYRFDMKLNFKRKYTKCLPGF